MTKALIGYSGFVGSNILNQNKFKYVYNSSNIGEIENKTFDLIVCAGLPAEKWKANSEPQKDLDNVLKLIKTLSKVKTKKFVLISTIDVYPNIQMITEDYKINKDDLQPYGSNRLLLEEYIKRNFASYTIIRLPGLFGNGLKKNFVYDLLNHNSSEFTHYKSQFQFYDLDNIWFDISVALKFNLPIVNFATEPITAEELSYRCFNIKFDNITKNSPVVYDMWTNYSGYYGSYGNYIYSKKEIIAKLISYIKRYKNNYV